MVLNLSLDATGDLPESTQWTVNYSTTDFTSATFAMGSADADKSLSCSNGDGTATCLVWGLNSLTIPNNVVASLTLTLANSPPDSTSPVQLTNGVSANSVGAGISTSASGGTVIILQTPLLSGMSCSPVSLTLSAGSTCTVTLSSTALGGGAVIDLSASPAVATVPATVTVPLGSSSATFPVSATAVTNSTPVTLTASYSGMVATFGVTVNPPPAALSGVSVNPTSIISGLTAYGMVSLSAAAGTGGAAVSLSSSNNFAAGVPATVTVPQGWTSATFTVNAGSVNTATPVTLTASYGGLNATFGITIDPLPGALSGVSVNPNSIVGGQSATGTVSLTAPAATGGAAVSLSSSNTAVASVPSSVTVPQGFVSATFPVTTSTMLSPASALLTASYSGVNATFGVTVNPATPALSGIAVSPGTVTSAGQSGMGTVTLTAPAGKGGVSVSLSSSSTSVVWVPLTVTIQPGAVSAQFTVTAGPVSAPTPVTLTASYAGVAASFVVTVNPPPAATAPATASFQGMDTTTQGNWQSAYNYPNVTIIGGGAVNASTTPIPSGQDLYVWTTSTTAVQALENITYTGRVAGRWAATENFFVDLYFTDQAVHQVAIYCLDWNDESRAETITVLNAATNAVLDTRSVSNFTMGVYALWNVTGHVRLQITNTAGPNAVISGIFLN